MFRKHKLCYTCCIDSCSKSHLAFSAGKAQLFFFVLFSSVFFFHIFCFGVWVSEIFFLLTDSFDFASCGMGSSLGDLPSHEVSTNDCTILIYLFPDYNNMTLLLFQDLAMGRRSTLWWTAWKYSETNHFLDSSGKLFFTILFLRLFEISCLWSQTRVLVFFHGRPCGFGRLAYL